VLLYVARGGGEPVAVGRDAGEGHQVSSVGEGGPHTAGNEGDAHAQADVLEGRHEHGAPGEKGVLGGDALRGTALLLAAS
jgi:hypothetical protein